MKCIINIRIFQELRFLFRLPYIEAIILETLRMSSILALGGPHRMAADTMFHGYLFPKDVTVISTLHTIHHDQQIWGPHANTFRPERFLNQDETQVIRHEALMPFSVGRRVCPGKDLASDTLFLFIANILHKFNISPDPKCPVVDTEPVQGFLLEHKPFKFVMNLREE